MEVSARVSLKVATKVSFRGKKISEFRFLCCFYQGKTEECDQKNWNFFDKSGIIMPGSATYFLEVSAHVSLEVATDDSFRDKETMKIDFKVVFPK